VTVFSNRNVYAGNDISLAKVSISFYEVEKNAESVGWKKDHVGRMQL
jgi:hypothetical protein